MKNVQVITKEYIFCPQYDKMMKAEECVMCVFHGGRTRIGFNSFVKCDYVGDKKED